MAHANLAAQCTWIGPPWEDERQAALRNCCHHAMQNFVARPCQLHVDTPVRMREDMRAAADEMQGAAGKQGPPSDFRLICSSTDSMPVLPKPGMTAALTPLILTWN